MNVKDIADCYDMDEEALTTRLKTLQKGYAGKVKEYTELLDEKAYSEVADVISTQAYRLKSTLKKTPAHMRTYLTGNHLPDWFDHVDATLEHLHQHARHMTATVSGRKPKFHRNWLVLRLVQTFKQLSPQDPTKDRLTDFMTSVCTLWKVDTKGLRSVLTELRKKDTA